MSGNKIKKIDKIKNEDIRDNNLGVPPKEDKIK